MRHASSVCASMKIYGVSDAAKGGRSKFITGHRERFYLTPTIGRPRRYAEAVIFDGIKP